MTVSNWDEIVTAAVEGDCAHCGKPEEVTSASAWHHLGMPVTRPKYVDPYIEGLTGPNEQHSVDPDAHCVNPKCGYHFTPQDEQQIRQQKGEFVCPQCGFEQNVYSQAPTYEQDNPDAWYDLGESGNLDVSKNRPANPGGMTRSGLTLSQMGDIGEQIVFRMHELPGIGTITPAGHNGPGLNFPIDAIIDSQRGKLGVEIKTNHSQAQERFKIGGKGERAEKIKYCLTNGLKPALVGVRLNFYTDKAYIFFREGLTDTWIGNSQMIHVATVDFADLNPFKSPDQQAQALAVDNAQLPDQSEAPDEFEGIFGPAPVAKAAAASFTIPYEATRLKVFNTKNKHTHDIIRCRSCGHSLARDVNDRSQSRECPTCGNDPTGVVARVAKIVLTHPSVDTIATDLGFQFAGTTGQGHRKYIWVDPHGTQHSVVVGSGKHGPDAQFIDAQRGRQRMTRCLNGQCSHHSSKLVPHVDAPGAPVLRAGITVPIGDREYFIMEVNGGMALVLDTVTGNEDIVETSDLQSD